MARVNTQEIPPDWMSRYKKALAQARKIKYPGPKQPDLADAVTHSYPWILEPPHIATLGQEQQRAYFLSSVNCFNASPPNERLCYYRLSLPWGLFYYNYYHSFTIPKFIAGKTCAEIQRPYSSCFKGEGPATWGFIRDEIYTESEEDIHLDWELYLDPAIYENHYGPRINTVAGIDICTWLHYEEPPFWACNYYPVPNAEAGGYFYGTHDIRFFSCPLRHITFYRSAGNLSESVLWKFRSDELQNFYTYQNWNPI